MPVVQDSPELEFSELALFEMVSGERVEKAMSAREIRLANLLARLISANLGSSAPGEVFVEMMFLLLRQPGLMRRPDVAYVPYDRWPERIVPETEAWEVTPALAAEIISKTNLAEAMQEKVEDYFRCRVDQVWVVYPSQKKVYVYDGPKTVRIFDENDMLDCGVILSDLQLSLRNLFDLAGL